MKKTRKKILVLTDDKPWGHRSIAKAIFNYLKENENNFEVELAEIKAETGFLSDLYVFAYRYTPASNRVFHEISKNEVIRDLVKETSGINLKKIKNEVERFNPDLIISAYFLHSQSLAVWRKKENKKFKLWTIVADPWSINPISFVKDADLSLVYDEMGMKEAMKYGIEKDKIWATGWWTRQSMYQKYDRGMARKKLGFDDDRPVIFVGGGSLGTNSLPKLLPVILMLKKRVGFVINTGTDKLAFNLVKQFLRVFRRLRKDDLVQIKHLGWIDNMAEVLGASDIVFGKAGPNFLFDVVAAEKPFVAMTHIGGQEDGNIDLIRKKKLGWVREGNGEIAQFLDEYLERPKYFQEKYKKNIMAEAKKNKETLGKILDRIKKE